MLKVLLLALALVITSLPAASTEQQECAWGTQASAVESSHHVNPTMSALVLGGTGAIDYVLLRGLLMSGLEGSGHVTPAWPLLIRLAGHQLVLQLLASNQWSKVTTVGRREVSLPTGAAGASKLQQVVLNLDTLLQTAPQAAAAFQGVDAVFCSLGTTRADAGSAEIFKKVDYEYVAAAAQVAKAAGVPYFGLVSAQGANANAPASDLRLLHPLLYTHIKGKAEEAVKSAGFARAAVFRPGLLDRGEKARLWEKIASPLLSGIPVADVAKAMILDAEAFQRGQAQGSSTATFSDAALRKAASSGQPPQ